MVVLSLANINNRNEAGDRRAATVQCQYRLDNQLCDSVKRIRVSQDSGSGTISKKDACVSTLRFCFSISTLAREREAHVDTGGESLRRRRVAMVHWAYLSSAINHNSSNH